jgi:cardiolipin synthase
MKNYRKAEQLNLVRSGTNYFDVIDELIVHAQHTLHLQTYIFESDATGKRVIHSLIEAARRGVVVFVLCDAFGSNALSYESIRSMLDAGIQFRMFSPLFSGEGLSFGRRLHHKIVVADGKHAVVGGINIADKYNAVGALPPWMDFGVRIEGDVCAYLTNLCQAIYEKEKTNTAVEMIEPEEEHGNEGFLRFRRNDWRKRKNEIHRSYLEALVGAESSVVFVASYFLPGSKFRRLLKRAAARGVDIKIILAGKSDVPVIRLAENYLYDFYLSNGIKIYEWTESVMHGKAMVVDQSWATVGSYNLNSLSHYLSIELNVDIRDKKFVLHFEDHLNTLIREKCEAVTMEGSQKKASLVNRIKRRVGYIVYKTLMTVMVSRRRGREKKQI